MSALRIGLGQIVCEEGEVATNLRRAEAAVRRLAAAGAELVVLPEMHPTGFLTGQRLQELAQPAGGPTEQALAALAAAAGVYLTLTLPERLGQRIHNTAVVFGPDGSERVRYRKVHLFGAEHVDHSPGDAIAVVDIGPVRAGLLICFDLEFPELARTLALNGAALLVAPSANMDPYLHHHQVFAMARALENHAFVAYCNRSGANARHRFPGGSALIDPWGRAVVSAGAQEALLVADADLTLCQTARDGYDYLTERRPQVYRL